MGWREHFDAIERDPGLTHRGKYSSEQAVMRRLLDEYEQHPERLLEQKWARRLRLAK